MTNAAYQAIFEDMQAKVALMDENGKVVTDYYPMNPHTRTVDFPEFTKTYVINRCVIWTRYDMWIQDLDVALTIRPGNVPIQLTLFGASPDTERLTPPAKPVLKRML